MKSNILNVFLMTCFIQKPSFIRIPDQNYKIQRLLLGTHTNDDEPNYLQIASVKLPRENTSEDTAMEDASGMTLYTIYKKRKK